MPLPQTRQIGAALLALSLFASQALAQNAPPPPRPNPPPANPAPAAPRITSIDPGLRPGADAGGPLQNLNGDEWNFFSAAMLSFQEVSSVTGTVSGEAGRGLGPRFNHNSCAACHAYPSLGGTSPARNTQVDVATLHGAQNTLPPFITADGPIRVARFVRNADGTPDGGVHDLFVISGRSDAPGCRITQPNFTAALANDNVIFRIPTPLFGLGLVEITPDANLRAAFVANADLKSALGVSGHFNSSPNDGTITRFGWKAQNKSLTIFAGEAYNVEQGVTNELFPNERESDPACQFNPTPEDDTPFERIANVTSPASAHASDSVNFAVFANLLAPPTQVPSAAAQRGQTVFNNVGCQTCHVATQVTGPSEVAALSRVTYHPYSDFALHNMGQALNDRITQGDANGTDWRTAPLWGVGQRLFFLHDGRTNDLTAAISIHESRGSEANAVMDRFNQLSRQDTADLLAFLRSL